MKFKLTAQEKKWILYDVGNSAFVLLVSTILPIYFNGAGSKLERVLGQFFAKKYERL